MAKENNIRFNVYFNDRTAGKTTKQLRSEARKLGNEISNLEIGTKEWLAKTAKLKQMRADMQKVNATMRTQKSLVSRLADGYNKYFAAFATGAAGITGLIMGFRKMSDTIVDFEKRMTNVKTLLSQDQIEQYGVKLDKTARIFIKRGHDIETVTKSMFDAISAGVDPADTERFMDTAERLAVGGVTELSTATDGLTSVMNAYGLSQQEVTVAADAFFSAQKAGKTTVAELAQNIGQIAPIAANLGVSYQELLSSQAAMTKSGISTAEATTYLKGALTALMKPTATATKLFEKEFGHGLGATEVKARGFTNVLGELDILMQKYPDAMAEAIPNVRGLTAVTALSGKGFEEYSDILKNVQTDIGNTSSLAAAYAEQNETTDAAIRRAKGELTDMTLALKDDLSPVIRGLMGLVSKTSHGVLKFSNFLKENRKTVSVLAKIIGYATGVLLTFKAVTFATQKATLLYGKAKIFAAKATKLFSKSTDGSTSAFKKFNKVLKANLIGIIVTALLWLGTIFYKNRAAIRDWLMSFKTVRKAIDLVKKPIEAIIKAYQRMREVITGVSQAERDHEKQLKKSAEAYEKSLGAFDAQTENYLNKLRAQGKTEEQVYKAAIRRMKLKLSKTKYHLGVEHEEYIAQKEALTKLENDFANYQIKKEREAQEEKQEQRKEAHASKKQLNEEEKKELQKLVDDLNNIEQSYSDSQLSKNQKELEQLDRKYEKLRERAKGNKELLARIDKLHLAEKGALEAKHEIEQAKKVFELRKKLKLVSNEELMAEEIAALDEAKAQKLLSEEDYQLALATLKKKYQAIEDAKEEAHRQAVLSARKSYNLLSLDEEMQLEMEKLTEDYAKKLLTEEEFQQAKADIEQKYADEAKKRDDEVSKNRMDKFNEAIEREKEVVSTVSDFVNGLMDEELEAAGDNEEKKKRIQKRYADTQMAINIARITADTAQAVMKALAQLGPVAGPIAGSIIAATGAVQVANAVRERNRVKAMAGGGYVDVISDFDNKAYRASIATTDGGLVSSPTFFQSGFLAGETRKPEYVIPGWLREDQQVADFESIIERKRVRGFAAGGDTSPSAEASKSNDEMMVMMRDIRAFLAYLQANGVKGVWEWEAFKDGYDEMTAIESENQLS